MNALPPTFNPGSGGRPAFGQSAAGASAMSMKWAALQEAANVVATLAGLDADRPDAQVRNFPALIRDAGGWRLQLAEEGITDIAAVMEPGITALLGINARGADPRAAALALWREYTSARAALLALLPPAGALGPRRSA